MPNVLVLGIGPLPVDEGNKLYAPGLRTWHIAQVLANIKFRVVVGLIDFGDFSGDKSERPCEAQPRRQEAGENVTVCRFRYSPNATPQDLLQLHRVWQFTCIVSTTDIMNSIAAAIPAPLPLWLDYNGDPFAEKQLQAAVHDNDTAIYPQWEMYLHGLAAGDRFSTTSNAQKHAMIGHLGFCGRLTRATAGVEMVHVFPACSRALIESEARAGGVMIKGRQIPAGSFMVLWSGGYNSWSDPVTLFEGLELAMREDSEVYFVSTGGEITGHDVRTFQKFKELVDASELSQRFFFAGWVPTEHMHAYYSQADAAINVDAYSYEGELGYRTRLVDWIGHGTPVVTTFLSELTQILDSHRLITTFDIGNPRSLCDALLAVKRDPAAARTKAETARQFFEQKMTEEAIYAPLIEWAQNPQFAPDRVLAPDEQRLTAPSRLLQHHQAWLTRYGKGVEKRGLLTRLKDRFSRS